MEEDYSVGFVDHICLHTDAQTLIVWIWLIPGVHLRAFGNKNVLLNDNDGQLLS